MWPKLRWSAWRPYVTIVITWKWLLRRNGWKTFPVGGVEAAPGLWGRWRVLAKAGH